MFKFFLFLFLFNSFEGHSNLLFSEELSSPQAIKTPSLLVKKLRKKGLHLKSFPVIYNPEVQRWIHHFSRNESSYMKIWLKRSYRYFPLMEKILQSRGLPKELLSITLIESSLSAKVISSAQAVGYWQFIRPTGQRYGLRINPWIDERQDFQKSTQAAAKYLYQLYEEFGDWLLSMAAYNMGENRLRQLINKYQTKNFWILYKKPGFPRETALYVPKILAAAHIIKRPELYGMSEFQVLTPHEYDVFYVPGGTYLKKIALATKIPLSEFQILNSDLKKDMIPKSIPLHQIRIPKGSGKAISKWLDKQNNSK